MEAKDLRVGNWVEIIQPKKDVYTTIQPSCFSVEIEKFYKPIQITEEWLKYFGFKYNNPTYEWYDQNAVFFIQVNYLGFDLIAKFHNQVIKEIKYVHELQNLYFALIGKELAKV